MAIKTTIDFYDGINQVYCADDISDIPNLYKTIGFNINSIIKLDKGEIVSLNNEFWRVDCVEILLKQPYQEFALDNEDYTISIQVSVSRHIV